MVSRVTIYFWLFEFLFMDFTHCFNFVRPVASLWMIRPVAFTCFVLTCSGLPKALSSQDRSMAWLSRFVFEGTASRFSWRFVFSSLFLIKES